MGRRMMKEKRWDMAGTPFKPVRLISILSPVLVFAKALDIPKTTPTLQPLVPQYPIPNIPFDHLIYHCHAYIELCNTVLIGG